MMTTRFRIFDVVRYEKDGVSYDFQIFEIRIDLEGIFYSGTDAGDCPVGWHKEKFLELLS
jgi:hypothetical protein